MDNSVLRSRQSRIWGAASIALLAVAYACGDSSNAVQSLSPPPATTQAPTPAPPGAPTGVAATADDGSATVTWTAPADTGTAAIVGYSVTWQPGNISVDVPASARSFTVTGLTNGTGYTFTVTARNSVGAGVSSLPSNEVTPQATPRAPSAPTGVTATVGDASATVSWTPPADEGTDDITGYTVTSQPGNISMNAGPSATSLRVTGLTNGTSYTFVVTAKNSVGSSAPSAASNAVTPTSTPRAPAAPTAVSATAGDASATVTWTAPADTGTAAISGYTVTSQPGNISMNATASARTLTVTGLTNGTSYTFVVTAKNSVGTSVGSGASNAVIPKAGTPTPRAPAAPTGASATAGNAAATVTWTAPSDTGTAAISGYTVTSAPGNISVNATAAARTATVSGLTNGTSYTFVVVAKNSVGSSSASAASNAVTPVAPTPVAPSAPTGVTATAGNGQATIAWQAPSSAGSSAIVSYTVTSTPGNLTASAAAASRSATVTGLANGTSYTFVVTAKNSTSTSPASVPSNAVVPAVPVSAGKFDTLANPNPMGVLTMANVVVPKGWVGRSAIDVKTGGGCAGTQCTTGEGANRFLCAYAKMAFDDPIVFPGKPNASHLHQFFGNTDVNANTTSATIGSTGSSTCSGGTANRTGYWTPALIDAGGTVVAPSTATIYYKSGYQMKPSLVQPMPTGLRMIAGDKNWSNVSQNQERVWWTCDGGGGPTYSSTIPACGVRVMLIVIFPQCWDGVNLDSPDHKSHMAYPIYSNATDGSKCPADHPVVVPEITEEFFWPVAGYRGSASTWHISSDMDLTKPGGLSAHADWMMGWDPDVMKTFVTLCLDMSKDCQVNGIGNNTYLNPPPQ
jgi:hypothetical protein